VDKTSCMITEVSNKISRYLSEEEEAKGVDDSIRRRRLKRIKYLLIYVDKLIGYEKLFMRE
jgi:hypothetical protein